MADDRTAIFDDPDALRALAAAPADPASEPRANFPLAWYEAFLRRIAERDIEVVTYADLFRGVDDHDHRGGYPREWAHWRANRHPDRPALIIQHDVDNHPFFTERMMALEHLHGIRSNVFIFAERYSRAGPGAPYPVDHAFLRGAERRGFVIGYHQNAVQLAGFDLDRAAERFVRDVEHLRSIYDRIEFMVPHGGVGGPWRGRTVHNYDLPLPPALEGNLRWVYNGCAIRTTSRWSDGGLRKQDDGGALRRFDIIEDFLESLKPGTRNFCLVHPQRWGYHVEVDANPTLAEQPWYREMLHRHGGGALLVRGAEAAGEIPC